MSASSFDSPYYPYSKEAGCGFLTMRGAEEIPMLILRYLLDLPDGAGYTPTDDNGRARVRLAKYLWNDGAHPLAQPLPTPGEKLSMLFDGNEPVLNEDKEQASHPKGYRLFAQAYVGQSQLTAMTTVKCYLGRITASNAFESTIGIVFEILCNVNQETTTRTDAYSRAYNIEQCIVEALNGVNIAGVGVAEFSRTGSMDNGSRVLHDEGIHVGREVRMSLSWAESEESAT